MVRKKHINSFTKNKLRINQYSATGVLHFFLVITSFWKENGEFRDSYKVITFFLVITNFCGQKCVILCHNFSNATWSDFMQINLGKNCIVSSNFYVTCTYFFKIFRCNLWVQSCFPPPKLAIVMACFTECHGFT